jgi:class 3 adenylate cyclase/tetratricopeptide (TPR) repeat protein
MDEMNKLEQGIAALEAQREMLGDAVVDAMLAPIKEKLSALRLASKPALTAEQRKQVTVLFADVSGFTALSDKMDAEDVLDKMNMLWSKLDQVIIHHGGQIDKHTGDGIMALFGATVSHEDDPERAVRAALEMQRQIHLFRADHPEVQFQMRIGLNTGPVLLGEVGSQREYTAMGDTVNLASRMEKAAPVGSVLISHDTYRHIRGLFEIHSQPPLTVKGKTEPVRTYLVLYAKPRAFRLQTRGIEGVETHMVGRSRELDQLQSAFRSVIADHELQAITISGDAGVGKSRLLYEFTTWADLLPEVWRIFKGRASEATQHVPYALLRDIFLFRFEIAESDPLAVVREKLEKGILEFMADDPDAVMKAHFIGHLIGFDFSASPHLRGVLHDTKQIRDRALHYLVQFFAAVTREQDLDAVVLLLEDIHWADDSSLDALSHVMNNSMNIPLLGLSFLRPTFFERRPDWLAVAHPRHLHIPLQPLSQTESNLLLDEILKKATEVPPLLREMVVGRAEGNPFYVEELIKVLIDEQAILPGEDEWRVVPEKLSSVRIPPTLTGILQTRLESLSPAERGALQCAAVVGRVFWESAVAYLENTPEMAEIPVLVDDALDETFQNLLRRELIYDRHFSAFAGTREFIFKHALLRDVTYETVLKRLRRTYHEMAATWLIEQGGERVNEYAGLIAEHYERAGYLEQAASWYGKAGEQATTTYAPEVALNYLQKALNLSADSQEGIGIHLKLAEVLELLGRWDEAMLHCQSVLTMGVQDGNLADHTSIAHAYHSLGQLAALHGDYNAALEWLGKARAEWNVVGDKAGLGQTVNEIGNLYWRKSEYPTARQHLEESLAIAIETSDKRLRGSALNSLGNVAYDQGDQASARTLYEESLAIKREMGDKRGIARALNNLANVVSDLGDNASARVLYEECLTQLREMGDRRGMAMVLNNLGLLVQDQGELDAAKKLHEESMELKRVMGDKPGISLSLNNLGIVVLEQKDYLAAKNYFMEGLTLEQEIGARHTLIYDLIGLASVSMNISLNGSDERQARRAAILAATAATHLTSLGANMEPIIRRLFDLVLKETRNLLGDEKFDQAWKEGQSMTMEDVLVYVREE